MSRSVSHAVAQCDDGDYDDDEMFKIESKDDDSCMGGSSTMFPDEVSTTRSLTRSIVGTARPASLKTARSLDLPANSKLKIKWGLAYYKNTKFVATCFLVFHLHFVIDTSRRITTFHALLY